MQAEVSMTFIVVHQGVFTYQVSSKAQINPFQTQVSLLVIISFSGF